ncbi:MAG: Crp/Fnr family transcriptional regulator [Clostridiales bacterium]|jgi:CRP-like cAMP-binding protein|nr:Crp/Fnr family transcriptional regulator [Clostridiales bacterium]
MIEKWLPILTRCGIFEGLQASDILDMMPCFQPAIKTYTKDDILCRIGDPQDTFGVVLEGEIIVQKEDYAGNRLIMGTFGPAELFGEVAAFARIGTWPNMVVANSRCQVLFLPIGKFTKPCCKICNAHQLLIENMLRIVSRKALIMNNRISYLKVKSMREKLAAFLYEQHQMTGNRTFMIPMNREQLADYLNVSRPSMSRELGRIRDEGVIDFYRSSFTIKDIEALRRMH